MKKNTVSMITVMIAVSLFVAPVLVNAEVSASASTETPVKKAHVTFVAVKRDPNSTSPAGDTTGALKATDDKAIAADTPKVKASVTPLKTKSNTIKKAPVKKAKIQKAPVKKAKVQKKAPTKKAVVKKAPAKKTTANKAPVKKTS